jgi:hypothetical protein
MGIMRHLERKGGAIQPRVVESATAEALTWQLEHFQPDVLHVIGHGRWFAVDGCVKLQLHPGPSAEAGEEFVTAAQLLDVFAAARHAPRMVVLSVCQTGSSRTVLSLDGALNTLPFAARLVAGGVPVVVAMAGDISDTACRVFTRALTQAIGDGVPIADAAIRGRRAAFHAVPNRSSADWLLPAVFLAENVPGDTRLVDTASIVAARHRCHFLELDWEPVFCGRGDFVEATDRLLDSGDPLNVLVAYTDDSRKSYGGMRLLRELAARVVRAGRLPVLLGPFDEAPPTSLEDFAEEISIKLDDMRAHLHLPGKPDGLVAAAGSGKRDLVRAVRKAFAELVDDLTATDPVRDASEPKVVLLCHRVDRWDDDVLHELFAARHGMLGPQGLGTGEFPVPVVLTGADDGDLRKARMERCSGAAWVKFAPLGRLRMDDEDPEDILAYLWWLLNPPERTPVYAPKRGIDQEVWRDMLRHVMRKVIYDEDELFGWAKAAGAFFTSDTDADILAGYTKAAP